MSEVLKEVLVTVLVTVASGLATWLTAYVVGLLNQKIKDKKLARYASDIFKIVMSAVESVFQTFVETMKKEGKFDKKAQIEAKEKAYMIICNQLTDDLKGYITDNFGDIESYLMNQIESVIYKLKNK